MTKKNLVSKRKSDVSRVRKSLLASLFDFLQPSIVASDAGRRRAPSFESLEDRRVLADVNFSIPTDGTPNLVELRRSTGGGSNLEIYVDSDLTDNGGVPNPVLDSTYVYSSVGAINITGSDNADQLKIDNANGLIARTVTFNGGLPTTGPGDSLLLTGNPGSTISRETYLVGATKDAGTWVVDPDGSRGAGANSAGNGDELVVNFTGLEPVASDLPATNFDVILSAANDNLSIENGLLTAPFTVPNLRIVDLAGTFETTTFANKSTVRIMGSSGGDNMRLNYSTAATGLTALELIGHIASGVAGQPADDNLGDSMQLQQNVSTVSTKLQGGGGDDLFTSVSDNLSNVGGTITIDGEGGSDLLRLYDNATTTADTVTVTSTSIQGLAPATFNYSTVETVALLTASQTNDTINITSTASGTQYLIGGSDRGSDKVTIGNTTADFEANIFDGSLDSIAGSITFLPDPNNNGDTDVLNVDDSGTAALAGSASITDIGLQTFSAAAAGSSFQQVVISVSGLTTRLQNFASANINYLHLLGSNPLTTNVRLETLNVRASQGADTIAVNATTATQGTTISGRTGNDTFTIAGDALSGANSILGSDGNDDFTLNISSHLGASSFAVISGVTISGEGNPSTSSNNRDRLTINDSNAEFVRDLNYDYQDTQGDLNILAASTNNGLFGSQGGGSLSLGVRTMETLIFNSTSTNDKVLVSGTSRDDLLTAALRPNNSSAFVFLDGAPYRDVPPETVTPSLPGFAGGGSGVDMLLNGINPSLGLMLDGSGTNVIGNQAIVQAASEGNVVVPGGTIDIFNLAAGSGVLIPGFGNNQAYDLVAVNDAFLSDSGTFVSSVANQVYTHNLTFGQLVTVNVLPGSFTNGTANTSRPGLIVNLGDESAPRANGIADHAAARPHAQFNIQVNGNLPSDAPGTDGLPAGDQLDLYSQSSFSIWSDKTTPPTVSIQAGNDTYGVLKSSIERILLSPGNGVINLIGDNNLPGNDQDDNYVLEGRDVDNNTYDGGVQEMTLVINGSAPLLLDNVQFLNAYGYDLQGVDLRNPGIDAKSDQDQGGIDTLDVRPYADNQPRGWNVHINFNEGAPAGTDGDQADLLIYRTSLYGGAVSEEIVVQPAAPDAGQLFANNAATNTPIVVIDYLGNTDIQLLDDDGFDSDTDTATLRGTNPDANHPSVSGSDEFVADFSAVGNAAHPQVVVSDSDSGTVLYRLQKLENFNLVKLQTLAGADEVTLIGRTDGSLRIQIDGGVDAQTDVVTVLGTVNGNDLFGAIAGSDTSELDVYFGKTESGNETVANLHNVDGVVFDGKGGTNPDLLFLIGSTNGETIHLKPESATQGTVNLGAYPAIAYQNLGSSGSSIIVMSNAENLPPADSVIITGTANADSYTWTPNAVNDGTLAITDSLSATSVINVFGIRDVSLDAASPGPGPAPVDRLAINVANANIVAGPTMGSGAVRAVDTMGQPLLTLLYQNVENPVVTGGTYVVTGTSENDVITFSLEDLAGDGTADQEVVRINGNPIDVTAADGLVINASGGDDTITVSPQNGNASIAIPRGLQILGGESGQDSVHVSVRSLAIAGTDVAGGGTLSGILLAGLITLNGIETLSITGADGIVDQLTVSNYGAASDLQNIYLSGGDSGNNDNDTLAISMTGGPDLITYAPLSASSATISRGNAGPAIHVSGFNSADDNLRVDGGASIDEVEFVGSASNDRISVINSTTAGLTRVTLEANASVKWLPISFTSFNALDIVGGDGNDQLNVDNTNGLITLSSGISYDGQSGNDALRLQGSTAVTTSTYRVGPDAGAGSITHTLSTNTQQVFFANLEPVVDVVAGSLSVVGTNAANQITYTATGSNGLIAIDGFETLEFANKTTVTLDGGAGSDTFSIAKSSNGFSGTMTIIGGDPTSGDTLIVNGSGGSVQVNTSTGTITGAGPSSIVFNTIEALQVNVASGAPATSLGVTGGTDYTYTPGVANQSGSIQVDNLPIAFTGISGTSSISLSGSGSSTLRFLGTSGSDLATVVSGTSLQLAGRAIVNTSGISAVSVILLDGVDSTDITSSASPYTTLVVSGAAHEDGVILRGNGTALSVSIDALQTVITGAGLASTSVTLTGVERAELRNNAGNITFLSSLANNHYEVAPTGANTAAVSIIGLRPAFVTDNTGTLSINDGVSGDSDTLSVILSAASETVTIDSTQVTVTAGATLKSIRYSATNIEALRVNGKEGSDSFNVTSGAIPIFVDGGDPIGETDGDAVNVISSGGLVTLEAGPESDEGGIVVGTNARMSFDHIESASITNSGGAGTPSAALIVGTGDDDNITVIARNSLTNPAEYPGADGVQDFTTILNDGLSVLWLEMPELLIDPLEGDDDVTLRLPAPNDAKWNVHVTAVGGSPSAPLHGDRFVLETPGTDTVLYSPNGSDTGTFVIDENGNLTYDAATDTKIELVAEFVVTNAAGVTPSTNPTGGATSSTTAAYRSSTGGFESLWYDGEGGDDQLRIDGTSKNDVFLHTPGVGNDEGTIRVNQTLALNYQNLGTTTAKLAIHGGTGGTDTLVVQGTGGSDNMFVSATSGSIGLNNRLAITVVDSTLNPTPSIETLVLEGFEGDDNFTIDYSVPYSSITANGGGPGGSDRLTVLDTTGSADDIVIQLGTQSGNGSVSVNSVATTYTGIEHIAVDASDDSGDNLNVRDEGGSNTWTVTTGPDEDRIQVTGRESIDYRDFVNVNLTNSGGPDLFQVAPTGLRGYSGTLTATGAAASPLTDVLEIIGSSGNDAVSSTTSVVTMNGKKVGAGSNLVEVRVFGLAGNDQIDLDLNLPGTHKVIDAGDGNDFVNVSGTIDATILGGTGDDYLIGSPLADLIDGGSGNDVLLGDAGDDTLYGGEGNDLLVGGTGNDLMFGGNGSDRFVWNPGDNSDLVEGDEGDDSLQFVGGTVADTFLLQASGARLRLERSPGSVVIDAGQIEQVDTNTAVTLGTNGTTVTTLSGTNEVPPTASTATGTVELVYDSITNRFSINLVVQGLAASAITAARIHVGAAGANGASIVDLLASSSFYMDGLSTRYRASGIALPAANINDLLSGNTYLNLSTAAFPSGAIRAQLNFISGNGTTGLTGADTFTVKDLSTTAVRVVNLGLGAIGTGTNANDASAIDSVTINGRTVSDSLTLSRTAGLDGTASTSDDLVNLAGLAYDVNVHAAESVDFLTINTLEGNDTVVVSDGLSTIWGTSLATVDHVTINGGQGDDFLAGYGRLNGEAGNDTLTGNDTPSDGVLVSQTMNGGDGNDSLFGGDGDDALNGGAGEDLFMGGSGADTIDGGADWDAILITGTTGNDVIDVNQTSATTLSFTVNGANQIDTLVLLSSARTVEEARIDSGAGADLIRVQNADSLAVDANLNSLQMTVHGGAATAAGDRLIVIDNGQDDLTIYRKGENDSEGTVTVGPANAEPLETVFDGIERVQFFDENGKAPNTSSTNSRLVVFKHDPNEYNDDRFEATHIGANQTVNVDPSIDPGAVTNPFGDGFDLPGDEDWYRVEVEVTGTLDLQVFFEEIGTIAGSGRPGLPNNGNLDIGLYDADGTLIAGDGPNFGTNNGSAELNVDGDVYAENERIRIPAVQGQVYYLRVFGSTSGSVSAINNYTMTIINHAPPTPYGMELHDNPANGTTNPPGQADNSDSGRSQFDNVTYDTTPTLFFRLDDGIFLHDMPGNSTDSIPVDEVIPIPFRAGPTQPTLAGYAIAIFDEGNTLPQTATAPQTPLGFATATSQEGVYTFTTPVLSQGSHFLTARVMMIDPATPQQTGFGPRSEVFEIIVDSVAPNVAFGDTAHTTDGLHPDSDSGVIPQAPTFVDRITNDRTPTFFGVSEANAIVRAYLDRNNNGVVDSSDVFLGMSTALPIDGSNQYPNGEWQLTSTVDLNAPNAITLGGATVNLTVDGTRRILVTAEDLAGNVSDPQSLRIMVDTQGPQVTNVFITADPTYNLFDLKPTPRPTPLVYQLTISVQDFPFRDPANFPDHPALAPIVAVDPGHYLVTGDYNGRIPVKSVTFTPDPLVNGVIATGKVTLTFFEPLPDDRFTLTVYDEIVDIAGNNLDGESNAQQPVGTPDFPSGEGQPGTDFVARFTIDSRPEIGTWAAGNVWIDTNGNDFFDPNNLDYVNRDLVYAVRFASSADKFYTSDDVIAGNFSATPTSVADGFDKLAVYGQDAQGIYRWLIDTDNDGIADLRVVDPAAINGIPFAGDFDGNPANGDEVGLFDGKTWYLDTNHDYAVNVSSSFTNGIKGWPIAGDFDGDGKDDLAGWTDDKFSIDLANNGFGQIDATIHFGYIGVRERPVAADIDQDGIDDLGLFVPDRAGQNPGEAAEWYFLISADPTGSLRHTGASFTGQARINMLDHAFSPKPLGNDLYMMFGDEYALPIIGNFDPPVSADATTSTGNTSTDSSGGNTNTDSTGSTGSNTNSNTNGDTIALVIGPNDSRRSLDVNNDGFLNGLDALLVINHLNKYGSGPADPVKMGLYNVDIDRDGLVVPLDAIQIINVFNDWTKQRASTVPGEGEGEGEGEGFTSTIATITGNSITASASTTAALTAGPIHVGSSSATSPVAAPTPVSLAPNRAVTAFDLGQNTFSPVEETLEDTLLRIASSDRHRPGNEATDAAIRELFESEDEIA